jgi:mRNA interferase MazF
VVIRRGDLWWAELRAPAGSEPRYRRPVAIVQSDAFNRSRIGTVVALAVTSNLDLARAPGNVLVKKSASGLVKDSVVNVSQIVTLDRSALSARCGQLHRDALRAVDEGLRLVLGI